MNNSSKYKLNSSSPSGNAASVKIIKDMKSILEEPVEGIFCEFANESNVFEWKIFFEGPECTPYSGGIFEARMSFPQDYPMSPPSLTIMSDFWHPNVYKDGRVCISILHQPGNDPTSGELAQERWMPTQTVSTIMLSFQSMLSDPNISSPANIDSSVMWRDRRQEFIDKVSKLKERANQSVPKHVVIPHPDTDPIQRKKILDKMKQMNELNTFSLATMEDSDDMGSDDIGSDDDGNGAAEDDTDIEVEGEVDLVDCPVCRASMLPSKGKVTCATCPIYSKDKKFYCGRKCYVLDCGEIRASGVCDNQIKADNGWKCTKNTHKDDKNGEDNFLEQTMV